MKKIANIYLCLFMLYYLQGVLYKVGGILSQVLLVGVLSISLYYFVYAILNYKLPTPLKILAILILIWTVYGFLPIMGFVGTLSREVRSFEYIKGMYMSMLPIYSFYVFARKGWLTEDLIKKWFFVFLVVAIANFYETQRAHQLLAIERGSSREEFTNNEGYFLLALLPLLPLFNKKPLMQYILLYVCMFFILMGFKRGAIFAGILCTVWMVYQTYKDNGYSISLRRLKKTRLFLFVFIVGVTIFLVQYVKSTSEFFNYRLQATIQGDSSGRDELYSIFWNSFINENNIIRFLFGRGTYGTLSISENYAHNDWLEIAIDNGLIVLLVFAAFWVNMFVYFFKAKRGTVTTIMLGCFIIIFFSKSIYSMFYSDVAPFAACALGYAMANYEVRTMGVVKESNI